MGFFSSTFFLFTPSPLLHLTSPSLIQQSHEKPGIALSKSWLQIVSSAVKTQWCRWQVTIIHSANVWWHHSVASHGPLLPPVFSYTVWSGFYWVMLLKVKRVTQPPPPLQPHRLLCRSQPWWQHLMSQQTTAFTHLYPDNCFFKPSSQKSCAFQALPAYTSRTRHLELTVGKKHLLI